MQEFNDFIDRGEVIDVKMLGRKYTWCNAFDGNKWSRIDRFLISPEWMERFKFTLWGLPRTASDHSPIVLMEDERDWGPRPFKFLNAWLLHSTLASLVKKTWKESQIFGTAGYILQRKLHALKLALKQWNREVYGNVVSQLQDSESDLHDLDLVAKTRPLIEEELKLQREKRSEVWRLSRKME